MKRPAFQFYAKDWRGNLKLRRCSDAAKGAWIEIMCVLHDSEEYGVARFPLKELVAAAGVQMKSTKELIEKGVLKGGDSDVDAYVFVPRHAGKAGDPVTLVEASKGPLWYCSRFVRDEYKRMHAGADTRFKPTKPLGGDPPSRTPSPRDGGHLGDGSAVASASAVTSQASPTVNEVGVRSAVDNPRPEGRNGHPRANGNWRHDPSAAARKLEALGLSAGRGESHESCVRRIEAAMAEQQRRSAA